MLSPAFDASFTGVSSVFYFVLSPAVATSSTGISLALYLVLLSAFIANVKINNWIQLKVAMFEK